MLTSGLIVNKHLHVKRILNIKALYFYFQINFLKYAISVSCLSWLPQMLHSLFCSRSLLLRHFYPDGEICFNYNLFTFSISGCLSIKGLAITSSPGSPNDCHRPSAGSHPYNSASSTTPPLRSCWQK